MSLFAPPEHFFDTPVYGEGASSRWFSVIVRGVGWFVFHVFFRMRVEGREYLDVGQGKAAVIAGNHFSVADPVISYIVLHGRARFIAKEELFEGPRFLAQGIARCGGIPVKRNTADRVCIKRAVASIARGEYVGIYPEGTRKHEDRAQTGDNKAGAVLIANMAHCPIIPMGISGTERIKPKGSRLLHFPKIIVRFGPAIDPDDYRDLPKHERATACIDEVMRCAYELRSGHLPKPGGERDEADGGE